MALIELSSTTYNPRDYVLIFSLEGAVHVFLKVQDIVVLDTDWPVQH
jgi:hypothetical protein